MDVLALATLVAHLHEGAADASDGAPGDPQRSLALGRIALAGRRYEEAVRHLERAVPALQRPAAREEAVHDLALAYRVTGQRGRAVPHWQWLAEHSAAHGAWARRQLAIYFEHHARDLGRALAVVEETPHQRDALEDWARRRARLIRKIERGHA